MWGSAAFDPAAEEVPAPAPYPDGTYAMTPSQFDAQVESWTAKQADFDASLRQDRAFVQLTRQREIRAAGAAAFVALVPLTSVFSALTALPVAPHADPAARALALHGACDRWAGAPVTGNDSREEETFHGVDVKAAEVERLALRVATTLLVVAAAVALGIALHRARARASAMRRAATFRDANARVSSGKKNETAPREISTESRRERRRASRRSPPPPRASPTGQPRALISALRISGSSRTTRRRAAPPAASAAAADAARRLARDASCSGGGAAPVAGHGHAPARCRRARPRGCGEVNAAANEAPTPAWRAA